MISLDKFDKAEVIALDFETGGEENFSKDMELFSVAANVKGKYISGAYNADQWQGFIDKNKDKKFIFHNAKFDLAVMRLAGVDVHKIDFEDTILMAHLLDETRRKGLKDLRQTELGLQPRLGWKDIDKGNDSEYKDYARQDALDTLLLYEKFLPEIKSEKVEAVYELEKACVFPTMEMEMHGVKIDIPLLDDQREMVSAYIEEAQAELFNEIGYELNLGSTKQVAELLFEVLEYPPKQEWATKTGYSTNSGVLEHISYDSNYPRARKVAEMLLKWRLFSKIESTFINGIADRLNPKIGYLFPHFNMVGTVSGRASGSNPNLQQSPSEPFEEGNLKTHIRSLFTCEDDEYLITADYCVAPDTKVLMDDLTWKSAEDVAVGDYVIGFPENLGHGGMSSALVERVTSLLQPCVKIVTDKGEVVSSLEHRWPVRRTKASEGKGKRKGRKGQHPYKRFWTKSSDIEVGDTLSFFATPWIVDQSREAGYLAGFFDGEGNVHDISVGFAQNEGITINTVLEILKDKGYDTLMQGVGKAGCQKFYIRGNKEGLRFVGSVRPPRLLQKSRKMWEGRRTWGNNSEPATVLSVERVGVRKVIGLQTSTKTFIANGFLSHNSQIELRVMAELSRDKRMIQAYLKNQDIHQVTADTVGCDRSLAKCVDPSSIISLNGRFCRIGSFVKNKVPDSFEDVSSTEMILAKDGKQVAVSRTYKSVDDEKLLIVARKNILVCSKNHKVLTYRGLIAAKDLVTSDVIIKEPKFIGDTEFPVIKYNPWGNDNSTGLDFVLNDDWAYLAGVFTGDGCYAEKHISIATGSGGKYEEWKDILVEAFRKVGIDAKKRGVSTYSKGGQGKVYVGSSEVRRLMDLLGLTDKGKTLEIPMWVMNNRRNAIAFLGGLIDTDGTIAKTGAASITTKSWKLAADLTILLSGLGIQYSLERSYNKTYNRYYYRIYILTESLVELKNFNCLRCSWKVDALIERCEKIGSYIRPQKDNYVISVENIGVGSLVDLEVISEDHLYWCNTMIVHNTINFGIGYGLTAGGLTRITGMSYKKSDSYIKGFWQSYPGLRQFFGEIIRQMERVGYVRTISGRKRRLNLDDYGADRQACNSVIQGTAADIMKAAMVKTYQYLDHSKAAMIMVVHDEISLVADRSYTEEAREILQYCMENCVRSTVPFLVNIHIGRRWSENK